MQQGASMHDVRCSRELLQIERFHSFSIPDHHRDTIGVTRSQRAENDTLVSIAIDRSSERVSVGQPTTSLIPHSSPGVTTSAHLDKTHRAVAAIALAVRLGCRGARGYHGER